MANETPSSGSLGALTSALSKVLRLSHFTIEASPDLVFWLAPGGRVRRVNQGAVRALGRPSEALLRLDCAQVVASTERDAWNAAVARAFADGGAQSLETAFVRQDNAVFPVDAVLIRIIVDDDHFACVLARDITDKKRNERNLNRALAEVQGLKDQLERENTYLRAELQRGFDAIVGESPAMQEVLGRVEQVAQAETTVLILGESGTGKELLARAIHRGSRRSRKSLVSVNCAALPANLIESELFGHEKGAFTNADGPRTGRFELADGGTLFLDEVGELPLDLQAKLLRVLQEGELQRLGSSETRRVDVRLLAATNQALEQAVADGRFRADLFYRLNVFPIEAPPLRDRGGDVALLADHFLQRLAVRNGKQIEGIAPRMRRALARYPWPGNVRELENVIERGVIVHREGRWLDHALPASTPSQAEQSIPTLREMEVDLIVRALNACNWMVGGKRGAARLLDMPPTTLRERMQRYGIERAE